MSLRKIAVATALVLAFTGCAVTRDQSTTGQFVDDVAITTSVKAKFAENKTVSATSINVETLNGTVQLSGFAKSAAEKTAAEDLARSTKNVKSVKNDIIVRP